MAAVKHYDHRERTNYHCYRLVNPRGLKQSLAEAQFDPGLPRFRNNTDPISPGGRRRRPRFAPPPPGIFEAPLHTVDLPERGPELQVGATDQGQKCLISSVMVRAERRIGPGRGKAAQAALDGSKGWTGPAVRAGDIGGGGAR
ncbi:hypothetical protein KXV51_007931 [Aspergillus fumigatus]|nr:hypothetical protein KXW14_002232 [Aspergillus fumigatus]KAH2691255.1 hypothetical protein KXV51_007931 [Aspergillus fumigatus]